MDKIRRQNAIAKWNVTKNRAWAMNEQDRIPARPLTGLSAADIENMDWTLNRTLDRIQIRRGTYNPAIDELIAKAGE